MKRSPVRDVRPTLWKLMLSSASRHQLKSTVSTTNARRVPHSNLQRPRRFQPDQDHGQNQLVTGIDNFGI